MFDFLEKQKLFDLIIILTIQNHILRQIERRKKVSEKNHITGVHERKQPLLLSIFNISILDEIDVMVFSISMAFNNHHLT